MWKAAQAILLCSSSGCMWRMLTNQAIPLPSESFTFRAANSWISKQFWKKNIPGAKNHLSKYMPNLENIPHFSFLLVLGFFFSLFVFKKKNLKVWNNGTKCLLIVQGQDPKSEIVSTNKYKCILTTERKYLSQLTPTLSVNRSHKSKVFYTGVTSVVPVSISQPCEQCLNRQRVVSSMANIFL